MIPHELAPYLLIAVPLAIIPVLIALTAIQSMLCILRFGEHVATINWRGLVKSDSEMDLVRHSPLVLSKDIICDRCGLIPQQWPRFFYPVRWQIHYNVNIEKPAEFIELVIVQEGKDGELTIQQERNGYSIGGSPMDKIEAAGKVIAEAIANG